MRRANLSPIGWHVIGRGTRRLELFRDDQDYLQYLNMLRYALKASGCVLWAFALMVNHYHLVIYGSSAQLSACMRRVNMMYSTYHNERYGLSGHTFDGPYLAFPQPSPLLLLRCVAYVFLNPVKAGVTARPEDYRWSCYRSFIGLPGSPVDVDPTHLMNHVNADAKVSWERFYKAMEKESQKVDTRVPNRLTMVEVHSQQFDWLLEHATESANQWPGEDPRIVACYWARQRGISPRAIASCVGAPFTSRTVQAALIKFRKRLDQDPDLARRLALP